MRVLLCVKTKGFFMSNILKLGYEYALQPTSALVQAKEKNSKPMTEEEIAEHAKKYERFFGLNKSEFQFVKQR